MNETEFYAVIKLVSGEEIFSLIDVDLEPEDPIIILQNPVKMKVKVKVDVKVKSNTVSVRLTLTRARVRLWAAEAVEKELI